MFAAMVHRKPVDKKVLVEGTLDVSVKMSGKIVTDASGSIYHYSGNGGDHKGYLTFCGAKHPEASGRQNYSPSWPSQR
ncbi:MAG: hypothetical protein ACOY3O_08565 [Thermodesulfobacteriota bacterium]